ncbi:hypothetical protein GOARA_028_00210 [Gordonia araii NBRC 100433]|uniref:Antitoxin FitA-like ribbon-helix-helix domain-containing protein n=2 Tax=Gordonia araii TaxID=263909 RepID=G7GZT5_9ACTN|nr:hypothetical protein GOARA_028_00210 [Gordonia araii NBRC 100433]
MIVMASVVIRGLDDSVKEQLAAQARAHGRSMEAELRDILVRAVQRPNIGLAMYQASRELGGIDLEIPARTDIARAVDLE